MGQTAPRFSALQWGEATSGAHPPLEKLKDNSPNLAPNQVLTPGAVPINLSLTFLPAGS